MKAAEIVAARRGAQGSEAAPLRLVKQGLSEFQKMWMEVYQETEAVTRNSAVGRGAQTPPETQSRPTGHAAPHAGLVRPQDAMDAMGAMPAFDLAEVAPEDSAVGGEGPAAQQGRRVSAHGLHMHPEQGYAGTGAQRANAGPSHEMGIGGRGPFTHAPILSGMQGGLAPELLASPLTQDAGAPLPLEAADVSAFRDVLDQLRALNPKEGQTVALQLQAGALGELRIEVAVQGRQVRADLITPHEQVKALLEGQQGLLQDALMQQGLGVERLSVNIGDPNGYFEAAGRRMRREGAGLLGRAYSVSLPPAPRIGVKG